MDVYFYETGDVKLSMIKYVNKVIDVFHEEIKSTFIYLESDNIFHIREKSEAVVLP